MSQHIRLHNQQKGFVLIGMMFLMLLVAVTAVALNRRAGMQARMVTNQVSAIQTGFDQAAGFEETMWELTGDPCRRTDESGEEYDYNGTTYNRKALSSTVTGFTDAITISVTPPGGFKTMRSSYRYYIHPPIPAQKADKAIHQVCRDSSNNLYFAVPGKHTIYRRNASDQEIIEVAGNGTSGYSGDAGSATSAQLNKPYGVYVDTGGDIYIADTGNHCIRKVDYTSKNISTIAGSGYVDYTSSEENGPATDANLNKPHGIHMDTAGNIYITDTYNLNVSRNSY